MDSISDSDKLSEEELEELLAELPNILRELEEMAASEEEK